MAPEEEHHSRLTCGLHMHVCIYSPPPTQTDLPDTDVNSGETMHHVPMIVAMCLDVFVQTHKKGNTTRDPQANCGLWCVTAFVSCNKCKLWGVLGVFCVAGLAGRESVIAMHLNTMLEN